MATLTRPLPGEALGTYRVPVTFEVAARSPREARNLLDDALIGDSNGTAATVQEHATVLPDGEVWGVLSWHHGLTSTAHAVVLANNRQLLSELGTIEVLRALVDGENANLSSARTLTDLERYQIRSTLQAADRFVVVNNPNFGPEQPLFEGYATEAVGVLPPGIYEGSDLGGRSLTLTVGVSRLAPSGYAAATFPASTFDSSVLDRISRTMERYTRHTPLTALVAEISNFVTDTGRGGVDPEDLHTITEQQGLAALVSVAMIVWSDDLDIEPTVLVGSRSVPLHRETAAMLHGKLTDSDSFQGAQQFLADHAGPAQWRTPEEIEAWLDALRESTPYPHVTFAQQPLTHGAESYGRHLAQALADQATQLGTEAILESRSESRRPPLTL